MRKRIIIDVNILFAGLISGKIIYLELFDKFDFYLPDFAMAELQKYQVEILRKSTMAHEKLKPYTMALFERLVVVPNILVTTQSYLEGFYLCKDIDEDDRHPIFGFLFGTWYATIVKRCNFSKWIAK
jgi:predicted nucleic acid-binding protein